MLFFLERFSDLQLDIVGFLAILGEGSILRNAQVASLSSFNYIPRLLPAPQALFRHDRPARLPTEPGTILGVYSGNIRQEINFFAQLLHTQRLAPYAVRIAKVTKKPDHDQVHPAPSYSAYRFGPSFWLSLLGAAMSVALLVLSVVNDDGMAMLATVILSLLSSLIGVGSKWVLTLAEPKPTRMRLPDGDVVICYPHGAFLIVRCEEAISRLYFAVERCKYTYGDGQYRAMSLVATLMLMFGVIFLANAKLTLQICYAATYIALNALYWASAAIGPQTYHWEHSYEVTEEHYVGENEDGQQSENFTTALWRAIAITGTSKWINQASQIAPVSEVWDQWLQEAGEAAKGEGLYGLKPERKLVLPPWDYQKRLTELLTKYKEKTRRTTILEQLTVEEAQV